MNVGLEKRSLRVEAVAGEGSGQPVIEGSVDLPAGLPTIGRPLQLIVRPEVTRVEPGDDRVLVEGCMELTFLYATSEEVREEPEYEGDEPTIRVEEHLHRAEWRRALPFTYLLEVPGANEESTVDVSVRTESVSYEVAENHRRIEVEAVLSLGGKLREVVRTEVTTGAGGVPAYLESEEVRVRSFIGEAKERQRVLARLPLGGRSAPAHVLEVEAWPVVTETTAHEGSATVRGVLYYAALYEASEGAGIQFAEWPRGAAFEATVEIEGIGPDARIAARVDAEVTDYRIEETEEGYVLEAETVVTIGVRAYRVQILSVLTGIDGDSHEVAVRTEALQIYEAVGEGETRPEVTGILELPDGYPAVDRVLRGIADVQIQDVHVLGDKVAVEGSVSLDVLYVGRGEGGSGEIQSVSWPNAITLDAEIPLPGAEPGLDRQVNATVRRVDIDLINRETLEARVQLSIEAEVGRERTIEQVAEAVVVPADDGDDATFTFLVVQEDDTLWKVAQVYRTTEAELLLYNEGLAAGGELTPGMKLCIPRRRREAAPAEAS